MLTVKSHRLVGADFQSAFDWYEAEQPGLGLDFAADFRMAYQRLRANPLLYAIRFGEVRRLNLRVLAVLHASRDTGSTLVERRGTFWPHTS